MTTDEKNVYMIKKDLYTYGRPGEYSPRIARVPRQAKDGTTRGAPSYRRVKGGIIPEGLEPEKTCSIRLLTALQAAEKVGEA